MKKRVALGALLSLTLAMPLATGCAPPETELLEAGGGEVGAAEEAIVDGTRETGRPEVVFVYNLAGGACTGAIIAPRVVLTAKHCVQAVDSRGNLQPRLASASSFRIYVGSSTSAFTAEYRVSQVLAAPGSWDLGDASDVGIAILSSPAAEAPMEIARTGPTALTGQTITAVGYGQTPSGSSGTKYWTQSTVQGVRSGLIFVEPTVCQGDSGGPVIGPDGLIYGVASFIYSPDGSSAPRCGTAPGAYNAISHLLSFIDEALEAGGSCVSSGEEVCDGEDNDCDERVDEGCMPLGSPCTSDNECIGGTCADTAEGRICTTACDPMRPSLGCQPGSYCGLVAGSCNGYCVPGGAGGVGYDEECTLNTDCASLFCVDPGDGRRRCLDPCRGDAGGCLAGEACAASPGSCNACVPAGLVIGNRALGEPCVVDDDCGSGVCYEHGGIRECARPCASAEDCSDRFECRATEDGDLCVRDRRQGTGGGCESNEDCGEGGICAIQGDRAWCTALCTDASGCPSGFSCVDAGGASVCAPDGALVGESCEAGCLTGLCATVPDRGEVCTSECDADNACQVGFECTRVGDTAICVEAAAPARPATRGGCAVTEPHPSPRGGLFLGLLGFLLGAWWIRRRFG